MRVWMEKTYVLGREDREKGKYGFGKALWSPQTDVKGTEIYKLMTSVKPGDILLHLELDTNTLAGISKVSSKADPDFKCLSGTRWENMPGYLITLSGFIKFDKPIPMNGKDGILSEENKITLDQIIDETGKYLVFDRQHKLKQGTYLTVVPERFLNLINEIYKRYNEKDLPYIDEFYSPDELSKENESKCEGLKYEFYENIESNPFNPRMLFDKKELNILKESINQVGVLVPLLVYRKKSDNKIIILDGERRWRCVSELVKEYPDRKDKWENIPVNIIPEPDMVSNILRMFNIHNVRESWDLMPTALKLEILIDRLNEKDDKKLAELTGLSPANVRRCKKLLTYSKDYQETMLNVDPTMRIKADFFIELYPLLGRIEKNLPNLSKSYSRDELIRKFLGMYREGRIKRVTYFRDLAIRVGLIKKGGITTEGCEKELFDLLDYKIDPSDLEKKFQPTKQFEDLRWTIDYTIEQIITFEPTSTSETNTIKDKLKKLLNELENKIDELEDFKDSE